MSCSAGVGRTGCFIVIDAMLERMKHEKTVDIYGHVTCMRSQRNYMVQTEDQYVFIHEALLEAATCGHTEVPARNLYAHIQKLGQVPPGESVTAMELEFKVGSGLGLPGSRAWTGSRGPSFRKPGLTSLSLSLVAGQLQGPHIPLHQCQPALQQVQEPPGEHHALRTDPCVSATHPRRGGLRLHQRQLPGWL